MDTRTVLKQILIVNITEKDRHRFWKKVNCGEVDSCWEWQSERIKDGYGIFWLHGKIVLAHRLSYVLANPDEGVSARRVLHQCDNPPCVNPNHLFSGTLSDNARDGVAKGRILSVHEYARRNGTYPAHLSNMRKMYRERFAKLGVDQVREIKDRIRSGEKQARIAEAFGVTTQAIYLIKIGKNWSDVA